MYCDQTRCDATWKIIHRICNQPELTEHWNNMPNAEKNCFVGDVYNIIRECGEDNV
jgi:hypothetical protein